MDPDDPFSNCWNSLELKPPHFEFFESTKENVTSSRQAVKNEYQANKMRDMLFAEMTLLSKFMSIRKNKYRSDKGFKSIIKIEKAVNRIHQLDLKTVTTLLKANLSGKFAPSKQVCQWLLIKLLSNGLLLNRTIECCKYSVYMLNHRLRTGHNWTEITAAMAMVSRIWSLAIHLIKICFHSYNKLVKIKDNLFSNPKDTNWIFINHHFPDNLEQWVNQPHNIPSFSYDGEEICHSSDIKASIIQDSKHHAKSLKKIKEINSAKNLKLFILEERKLRQLGDDCVSKYLSPVQWEVVHKKLLGCYKMLKASNGEIPLLKRIRKKIKKWLVND